MNHHLVCGGLTFEKTPVELREKAAFREAQLPEALARMAERLGLREAVLLSTCNRVEYFGVAPDPERTATAWPDFLRRFHAIPDDFSLLSFQQRDAACVEHLFAVASGLKSMVVGETEIFGQIKRAYEIARLQGRTGKRLNRLFQSAFAAAKAVRSRTAITRGHVSVGSVAVELAERILGDLPRRRVMIIGAGETGERTARALLARGVTSTLVANRTHERARLLAAELGGAAIRWDDWESRALQVDIMISSTGAPHYMLTRERLETLRRQRGPRPLLLIDLAVPRDIEPAAGRLPGVHLHDIDDLRSLARRHLRERQAEIARSVEILQPHVERYLAWAERQDRFLPAQRVAA